MRALLDTNAVSEIWRGNERLARSMAQLSEVVLSTIVAGELIRGFRSGRRFDKNMAVFRRFLAQPSVEVCDVDFETAETYGRLRSELDQQGTPIPSNDVWIAAQAIESAAELWSFDGHFGAIKGLAWRRLE